jgi:hypothetical protein
MNRFFNALFTLCAICTFLPGCSSMAGPAKEADKIAVYEAVPLDKRAYQLVKRIWVASGRSAGIVPAYSSAEEGASAFRDRAAALGGDAVMNFGCYQLDGDAAPASHPSLICNGNVIRYLQ